MSKETKDWLEAKFQDWRHGKKRSEDSVEQFALYVGVSLSTMNNWLNRGQTPGKEKAGLIAAKLGMEIFDLLGLPRPDPLLQLVIEKWGRLPDDVRTEIAETVERAEARAGAGQSDRGLASPKRRREAGN